MAQPSPQDNPGRGEGPTPDPAGPRNDELAALEAAARVDLGDPDLWFVPTGYRKSLALCVIDASYATGMDPTATTDIVNHYVNFRQADAADSVTDGLHELLRSFKQLGSVQKWAEAMNDQSLNSADGPRKAAAVQQVSLKFVTRGVATVEDLSEAIAKGRARELRRIWCSAPGQESGVTWTYLLALAGIGGAKTDPLVAGYVARALGVESVSTQFAAELMNRLATRVGWDPVAFHLTVWQFESTR
ncbi:heme peroxidase [Gordonia sp. NPDC003424]